jgi:p-aminobenzoyl-glutamate transporter AbgT
MEKMSQTPPRDAKLETLKPEIEHEGTIWKHPYMVYIVLTVVLFIFLLVIAWMAYSGGWIPNKGTLS